MSHTEKDCSIVADEDKETGYGWGMDLRASPRKGLSKNKEEIDALKLNKSLFVLKPMSSPKDSVNKSTTMSSAAGFFLDGDVGCSTFLSEENEVHVSDKNQLGVAFDDVAHVPLKNAIQHLPQNNALSNVGVAVDATVCSLDVRSTDLKNSTTSKKIIKVKRKFPRRNFSPKPSLGDEHNGSSVGLVEPAVKRKSWNLDVVMEESDGDSKRSCVGSGVSLKQIDDSIRSVASVGAVQQPRE